MKLRKSVFVVVYSKKDRKFMYLILKRKLHWIGWEFPKGGLEKGESERDAVLREIKEETGLKIKSVRKFDVKGEYNYGKEYSDRPGFLGQSYSLYAVEVEDGKVKIDSEEHSDYRWESFKGAMKNLTWENQRDCLAIVDNWLFEKNFRSFITKSGRLVIGGRDEETNEFLVGQVEPNEIVLHTREAGSPFVNIKGNGDNDIKEAAVFCARYSKDWKKNKKDVEVHMFKGKDIFKGKGMKVGTFGVRNVKVIKVSKKEIENFK